MRVARLALFVALGASRAAASSSTELEEFAGQLGDPDPRVRATATKALIAAGPDAEARLREVATSADPEMAGRATGVLHQLKLPAIEELSLPDTPELVAYRNADRETRGQLLGQLIAVAPSRPGSLVRVWAREADAELRRTMFQAMVESPAIFASALIAYGYAPVARQVLDAALAKGDSSAAAPYAAMCVLQDETEAAIARWSVRDQSTGEISDEPGGSADVAAALMARLHRGAGSPKAAIEWAGASGEFSLLVENLRDARDWPALAKVVAAQPNPSGEPALLNLLCGAHILAGDPKALDGDIERLRKIPDEADNLCHVLLLAGRVDDALRALTDANDMIGRFKLLVASDRLNEAFELVTSQDAVRDDAAIRLRLAAAEQFYALGDSKRAVELASRCATENQALHSDEIESLIGETFRKIGEPAKAWDHFRAALKAVAERKEDVGTIAWRAFQSDPDGDGEADLGGANLWGLLQFKYRGAPVDQQFDRARAFVDRTMSIDDLQKLASTRGTGAPMGGMVYATQLIRTVGQRMKDAGQDADAEKYLVAAAERAPLPENAVGTYLRLGDWAAEKKDWTKAANWYGRAWNAERSRAGPLYLRAWALREAGWHAKAAELFELAYTIPLADPWRRMESIRYLNQHRATDALSREIAFTSRTSRPDIYPADLAHRMLVDRALRDGNWLEAAALNEGLLLNFATIYGQAEPGFFLRMPHTIHRLRAKGLLARGDVAAAEREIAMCRVLMPSDIMLAIDVVPEFERLGNKPRADELYAEAMRHKDELFAKYPDAANDHNDTAWLAINCGRDADKALVHARRAVELRPKNASYIDTLAEAQFRHGEIDEAIKSISRCVELEPRMPRHREQLERFEAAKRGEVRAMPPG